MVTKEQKATLTEIARQHSPDAIETLVSIMKASDSDSARISAATSILDRGYGKPQQGVDMNLGVTDKLAAFFDEVANGSKRIGVGEKD